MEERATNDGRGAVNSADFPLEERAAAAGAVYAVYCLYYSQHSSPRTLIYLTPEDVDAMALLAADVGVHHSAFEAVLCLQRLVSEDAFLLGAVPFRERDVFGRTEEEAAQHRAVVEKQISVMKDKLFAHMALEEHLATNLVDFLGVEEADALGSKYEAALRALPNPPAGSRQASDGGGALPNLTSSTAQDEARGQDVLFSTGDHLSRVFEACERGTKNLKH